MFPFFSRGVFSVLLSIFGWVLFASQVSAVETISTFSPSTAQAEESITLRATLYYNINWAMSSCVFNIRGRQYPATIIGDSAAVTVPGEGPQFTRTLEYTGTFGTASSANESFSSDVYFSCVASGFGSQRTISGPAQSFTILAVDVTPPGIGTITPTVFVVGQFTLISVPIVETNAVTCELYVRVLTADMNSSTTFVNMSVSAPGANGARVASVNHTFSFVPNSATEIYAVCRDASNLSTTTPMISVVLQPQPIVDTTSPVIGALSLPLFTVGQAANVSVSVTEPNPVTCQLYSRQPSVNLGGSFLANMSVTAAGIGGARTASIPHTFNAVPSNATELYVVCTDEMFNVDVSQYLRVTVQPLATSPAPSLPSDVTAPSMGAVPIMTVQVGTSVNFSATYTDAVGVVSCALVVNGDEVGTASRGGGSLSGSASRAYTFLRPGVYTVAFRCYDAAGNQGTGGAGSVTAQGTIITTNPTPTPVSTPGPVSTPAPTVNINPSPFSAPIPGRLIKLPCPTSGSIDLNHPCKVVYYYGADGRRHTFPHERIYFTWYADFSSVMEISAVDMANISLGRNVVYRPGVRMVKFTTVPKVYAVGRNGSLHWVASEAVARGVYGEKWNLAIDDLSDAFFTNYSFGSDLLTASDFITLTQTTAVNTIDQNS